MPHEAYHQALMLAEIVDKLQKENQQQKLTIKRMERAAFRDELGGIPLNNTGSGSHEPQPTSMSPKSDFIASLLDDQGCTDPETLKTLNRWILDVADEAPDLKGGRRSAVSIPERTQPRSHQEVQAQLLKEAKQRIKSLEKQIMIDAPERNEAYRTIANQKHLIVKYRKRLWFVTHKLLLAEQITRLQSYVDSEE